MRRLIANHWLKVGLQLCVKFWQYCLPAVSWNWLSLFRIGNARNWVCLLKWFCEAAPKVPNLDSSFSLFKMKKTTYFAFQILPFILSHPSVFRENYLQLSFNYITIEQVLENLKIVYQSSSSWFPPLLHSLPQLHYFQHDFPLFLFQK